MHKEKVIIKTNIPGDEQESGYMNGTLQHTGCNPNEDEWAYTIHTYLDIPKEILKHPDPQEAIARYVGIKLNIIAESTIGISFEVEIGPTKDTDSTA